MVEIGFEIQNWLSYASILFHFKGLQVFDGGSLFPRAI
jgi:hypothetical protein